VASIARLRSSTDDPRASGSTADRHTRAPPAPREAHLWRRVVVGAPPLLVDKAFEPNRRERGGEQQPARTPRRVLPRVARAMPRAMPGGGCIRNDNAKLADCVGFRCHGAGGVCMRRQTIWHQRPIGLPCMYTRVLCLATRDCSLQSHSLLSRSGLASVSRSIARLPIYMAPDVAAAMNRRPSAEHGRSLALLP